MKLYLSSFGLGDNPKELKKLVDKHSHNNKVAYIANALDFSTNLIRRMQSVNRDISDLKEIGLDPEEIDLRDYFGKKSAKADLQKRLSKFGTIYVTGGNVFILRRAMQESGLDEILKSYRDQPKKYPKTVYAGSSTGACVLSTSLEGLELVDEPDYDPEGYNKQRLNQGLGFINYSIAPHFRSDHPEAQAINSVVKYYMDNKVLFKALRDGEVIVEEV
jgi:dipeptidase E